MTIQLADITLTVNRAAWGGFYCDVKQNGKKIYTGRHGNFIDAWNDGIGCAKYYSPAAKQAANSPQFNQWGQQMVSRMNGGR